jgi:DNA-binding CsgD family transcriptional regulator
MATIELSGLIDQIYEAALNPSLWPVVVDATADLFNATIGNLSHYDWVTHESINISRRVDPGFHRSYAEYYAARNPYMQTVGSQPVGSVFTTEDLFPRRQLVRAEIYGEWFSPQGMDTALGANLGVEGTRAWALGLWRPWRLGAFHAHERQLLALITPHLRRALKISARLAETDLLGASLTATLDQLTHGVALLDGYGRVQFLNRFAEDLVAAHDGLSMRDGALSAARSDQAAALQVAIQRVASARRGAALQLERPSGKRALTLLIAPLHVETAWLELRPPAALVIITDPERGGVTPKQRLIDAYRLTPAEATLVMGLLLGHDLGAIADELKITYETARTHLRRVLVKTDTHRQTDLVRLLVREVGILR